jgi:hypothetical protein
LITSPRDEAAATNRDVQRIAQKVRARLQDAEQEANPSGTP